MAEACGEPYDSSDEYNRDDRIETYYDGWGAREMAERIVELEDELGADVDGICTGMHADVAEAHSEVERLTRDLRVANAKIGGAALFVDQAQARINMLEGACDAYDGIHSERDRYRTAWKSARRRAARTEVRLRVTVLSRDRRTKWLSDVLERAVGYRRQRDRYRLAWLSARRRAADEANFGMEALDRERERYAVLRRAYLRSGLGLLEVTTALVEQGEELEEVRKTAHGPPRLEHMGTEEDGGTVWRLLGTTKDGADIYTAPLGTPAPKIL